MNLIPHRWGLPHCQVSLHTPIKLGERFPQSEICHLVTWENGYREMAQQLQALAALAEEPGSVPSTHVMAHKQL